MKIQGEIDKISSKIEENVKMLSEIERKMKDLIIQKTLLKAELIGLEQQSKALADEMVAMTAAEREESGVAQTPPAGDLTKLTLVDAVEHVINESAEPMRIDDVRRRLRELGRDDRETSVGVTLHHVASKQKIRRVGRALYARLP